MSLRILVAVSTACLVMISATLLITGSPALAVSMPGLPNLPLGTLIAWVGAISLPLCIYSVLNRLHPARTGLDRIMVWVMWLLMALAIAWAPVSYWLSGNMAFEFRTEEGFRGGERGLFCFFYYSMALIVLPVAATTLYAVLSLLFQRHAGTAGDQNG